MMWKPPLRIAQAQAQVATRRSGRLRALVQQNAVAEARAFSCCIKALRVCACAYVCMRARVCVRAFLCVRAPARACVCVCVHVRTHS